MGKEKQATERLSNLPTVAELVKGSNLAPRQLVLSEWGLLWLRASHKQGDRCGAAHTGSWWHCPECPIEAQVLLT